MAIIRLYTGRDGKSHFEDIEPCFEPRGDKSESVELISLAVLSSGASIRLDQIRGTMRRDARRYSPCPARWTSK
jgi:hypothetical protein